MLPMSSYWWYPCVIKKKYGKVPTDWLQEGEPDGEMVVHCQSVNMAAFCEEGHVEYPVNQATVTLDEPLTGKERDSFGCVQGYCLEKELVHSLRPVYTITRSDHLWCSDTQLIINHHCIFLCVIGQKIQFCNIVSQLIFFMLSGVCA